MFTFNKLSKRSDVEMIRYVTWVGFWINAGLMVLKLIVGWLGHSDALVADGVHSLSDFATDIVVIVFVGIAYKGADSQHPYGHGKFETFASLLIAFVLAIVAGGIIAGGVKNIVDSLDGHVLLRPDVWTIWVAFASILAKEWLYRYTAAAGRKIDSSSLIANAWHHRSDAISSIATLIGVSASFFLGEQWRILDPIASVIIGVFILVSAFEIAKPSVNELLEKALPDSQIAEIEDTIKSVPGVISYHKLRTRRNGRSYIIDVDIQVDPDITVTQGHSIAGATTSALKELLGDYVITSVHIEPYIKSE